MDPFEITHPLPFASVPAAPGDLEFSSLDLIETPYTRALAAERALEDAALAPAADVALPAAA